MAGRRRIGLALALLVLPAMAPAIPSFAQVQTSDRLQAGAEQAAGHQILVLLRLPRPHLRPYAGHRDYYGDAASQAARRRSAERLARRYSLALVDGWPMPLLGVDCYVMRVADEVTIESAIARISRERLVAWAEPMRLYRAQGTSPKDSRGGAGPNDPLFRTQPATVQWHLNDLHRVATGRGVKVAVIDSRVEAAHPDLAGQIATERDFVTGHPGPPEQHGTGVAGVIAAREDNGIGIVGIAPAARLMALRACWQTGPDTVCDTLSLAKALVYAIENGADIINLSLGGPADRLLSRLIGIAVARQVPVVAAFNPAAPGGGFPASLPGVLAVGDESLPLPARGVYGAPARDIPTTQPGGRWYLVSGSSYAAAHVSGLLALMHEHGVRAPVRPMIVNARGTVDACASLVRTDRECACGCATGETLAGGARP